MSGVNMEALAKLERLAAKKQRAEPTNVRLLNPVVLHFQQGPNPRGDYRKGDTYKVGDAVAYKGATYMALLETNSAPDDEAAWRMFVPRGEQGIQGLKGDRGDVGPRGADGKTGKDGAAGAQGPQGERGPEGPIGPIGMQGIQGPRGLRGEKGSKGDKGDEGPQGRTGVGFRGLPGQGVAAGGSDGQVLAKASNDDYDTEWVDQSAGGVSDGDKGDITVSASGATWTIDNGLAATKIADGSISNTEFQHLNNVSSNIQTQLDAKAALAGATFVGDVIVPPEAYGAGWNGSNEVPTKNDVYDQIESLTPEGSVTEGFVIAMAVAL